MITVLSATLFISIAIICVYYKIIKMKKNKLTLLSKGIGVAYAVFVIVNIIFIIKYINLETINNSTQREGIHYIFKSSNVIKNVREYSGLLYNRQAVWDYYRKSCPKKNAMRYIITPTPDKMNQTNHPDVVYFQEGLNGYKYWMACTPYANSKQKNEDPNILVSNDGLHFKDPRDEKEPVISSPKDASSGGHLSDTDMYYKNNEFVLHYVYNKKGVLGPSEFYRATSKDGIHWNKPELTFSCKQTIEGYSPAYIQEEGNTKMWYVGGEGNLDFTQSNNNEKTWSRVIRCNINMKPWKPWHVDIIKTDKGYEGLLCARNRLINTRALFYISSIDGVDFKCSKYPIIFPSKNGWDNSQIYRSTMIKNDGKYRIWYSAMGYLGKWHIGYTEFTLKEINKLGMN